FARDLQRTCKQSARPQRPGTRNGLRRGSGGFGQPAALATPSAAALKHIAEAAHIDDVAWFSRVGLYLATDAADVDLHDLLRFALRVGVVLHGAQDFDRADYLPSIPREVRENLELCRCQ